MVVKTAYDLVSLIRQCPHKEGVHTAILYGHAPEDVVTPSERWGVRPVEFDIPRHLDDATKTLTLWRADGVVVENATLRESVGYVIRRAFAQGYVLQVIRREGDDETTWWFPLHPCYGALLRRALRRTLRARVWSAEDLLQVLFVHPEMRRIHALDAKALSVESEDMREVKVDRLPVASRGVYEATLHFEVLCDPYAKPMPDTETKEAP